MRRLALRAREIVHELHPGAVEVVWERQRIAGYGVGPKKMSEHYAYLAPQTRHLNVGFYRGSLLEDPAGLLEGTGKLLRHAKVVDADALEGKPLRALLVAARAEREKALGL